MTSTRAISTRDFTVEWPDTRAQRQPPRDHLYASATWLLGRHPTVGHLAQRIPGVVSMDAEGPFIDVDLLSAAVREAEVFVIAWRAYEASHRAPDADEEPTRYSAWREAGPRATAAAEAVLPMSRSEQARLRLLAAFAGRERVPLAVADLASFDGEGQRLLTDWCAAVARA